MHHPLLSMHNSDPISWNLTTTIGISLTWPAGHVSKMVPYSRSARSIESCAALCTLYGTMIVLAHKHRFGTSARGQNPAASSTLLLSPCALVVSWVQSRRLLRLAAHRVPHRFWTFVNQQDLVGWVVYSTAMWSPRWELRFAAFGYS